MCLYWPIYWYWYCHQPKNLAFLLTYLMIFLFVLSHCLVPLPLLRYILDMNSVSHYTPARWPPGIYVMGKRPDVQVCICNHKCPTFNHIPADFLCHQIKLATHSTCHTRLQNRSFFWHPELSPFLSSISLLVIIALTLNAREINQNDFFKVNGCKESKRGRTKIAMLSLCPLGMEGKDKPKCRELEHWFSPATHLLQPSQRVSREDRTMS